MININEAADLLDTKPGNMHPFEYTDPFNDCNVMTGFLCRESNHRYGALVIAAINGEACTQVIWATPKLKYPFDKQGTFRFPPVKMIWAYDKLDGTNILAYRYKNGEGVMFTTYKLRLSPFVGNTRYGAFLDMWQAMLSRYPDIRRLPEANGCSIGFELYGANNEHLIRYSHSLDCALLYGVSIEGAVIPPEKLLTASQPSGGGQGDGYLLFPTARLLGTIQASEDPVASYRRLQKQVESQNRTLQDGKIEGSEGSVWFVEDTEGNIHVLKCKPASIEAIHWASGGINKASILNTCQNCLETEDALTWYTLYPLLREEYEPQKIEDQRPLIEACIAKVNGDQALREKVVIVYRDLGLDIRKDKGGTMRALSKHFDKQTMKQVFAILNNLPESG